MSTIYNKQTRLHELRRVDIREGEVIESKTIEAGWIMRYNSNPVITMGDVVVFEKGFIYKDGEKRTNFADVLARMEVIKNFLGLLSDGLVIGRYKENGEFEEMQFVKVS